MDKQEKLKKLKQLIRQINKDHKEVVLDLASNQKQWERLSTGITEFDNLIGGGWVYGHTNILWGGEAIGKSTLMYHTIVQAQKDNKIVAFLDLEDSFNKERAEKFGINLDELFIGHYTVAEQALDTIIRFAKEKAVDVIILDSIHSMSPKQEIEDKKGAKSVEKDTMALLARKMSQFFRMAGTLIYNANIALIMIGQTRTDLGGFIALQKLSGGKALVHNSILTIHVRKGAKADAPRRKWKEFYLIDDKLHYQTKDVIAGFDVVAKIDKKQVSGNYSEGTEIHLPFYYDTGFIVPVNNIMSVKIVGSEDEKQKIKDLLTKKEIKDNPFKPNHVTNILEDETQFSEQPKKKKRGRPKKEK